MSDESGEVLSELARAILVYAMRNERAQTTARNIGRWWLRGSGIEASTSEVMEALAGLMARGFVLIRRGPNGSSTYRLNAAERDAIARLLGE